MYLHVSKALQTVTAQSPHSHRLENKTYSGWGMVANLVIYNDDLLTSSRNQEMLSFLSGDCAVTVR